MGSSKPNEITVLLNRMSDGSDTAPGKLLELVYDDLRRLAGAYMQNERTDHTLQATALVHEAYMRLVVWKNISWQSRAQKPCIRFLTQRTREATPRCDVSCGVPSRTVAIESPRLPIATSPLVSSMSLCLLRVDGLSDTRYRSPGGHSAPMKS